MFPYLHLYLNDVFAYVVADYCPSGSGSDSETYCKKSKKNNKPPMDNNTFVSIALRLMANLPESDIQDLQLRIFSMIENEYAKYE